MKYTIFLTILSGMLFTAVSCKEAKQEEVKAEPVTEEAPAAKPAAPEMSAEEKRLKTANKKLGWIMQDMEVPEYKLDKLYKKGDVLSADFVKYATEMIANAKKFKEIDHPDEKLVELGNKMLEAMSGFESAITSKNLEGIKTSWGSLTKACAACHKDYKKGGGGY